MIKDIEITIKISVPIESDNTEQAIQTALIETDYIQETIINEGYEYSIEAEMAGEWK